MNRRTIPFGYKFENGQITVDEATAEIVKEIFTRYISGESMLNISALLNRLHVEYSPGIVGWNKARIKRILENQHYIGDEKYPDIISLETAERANELKGNRNNQKNINKDAAIYNLDADTICPCCGSVMRRINEPRSKIHERWKCQNKDCGKLIIISDKEFLRGICEILAKLTDNPDIIQAKNRAESINLEAMRLENDIKRIFDSRQINKDQLRKKLLESVSVNYNAIDTKRYEAQRLRNIFENFRITDSFPIELFNQAVETISFDDNDSVIITLITGQSIRKGELNAAS